MKNYFLFVFCLLSLSSLAQVNQNNGITYKVTTDPNKPVNYYIHDVTKTNDTVTGRYIIKFKSDPQIKSKSARRSSNLEFEHNQFADDLVSIESVQQQKRNSSLRATKVHHNFKAAFNGKAITASRVVVDEIRKLSYVHYVVEDKEIKVSDDISNSIIEADKVWSQLSVTGKGVVIGIVDTGIDYKHPDISDGIGPGHKVLGGYDFVNNDNDPMDDHGHGTHVSGIAAANGPNLKGVAPDAKLMGFKVLTAEGWGLTSWIIAGIERCLDPDQNPATDDKVDVVNMSLGGSTNGPDPISEAVDNAVSAGVVFAIAAGNDGFSGYGSIGSPGISENAITVGATDSNDFLAAFSSKGPAPGSFALKPDIVAPGVKIYSSLPNEKYASWDGTSMATPHVTGAAALLLQLHPDWTPAQVKATLMQNATPLPTGAFDVGAGRLNVLMAAKATYNISPGSVSLGLLDRSQSNYTTNIALTVTNFSGQAKTFNLFADGDLNFPGVTTTISKSTLTLGGNESQVINVKVSIQTLTIPIRDLPDLFLGSINISDNITSYKVPVGFVNPNQITLHFEKPFPDLVVVFGVDNFFFKFYSVTSETVNIPLLQGQYNFVANYPYRYVVKEDISIPQTSSLSISKSDATNLLVFQPVDENGKKLPLQDYMMGHTGIDYVQPGSAGLFSVYPGMVDTLYTSNLSTKWNIGFKLFDNITSGSPKFYEVSASTKGVTQNKTFINDPSDFVQIKYDYDHYPSSQIDLTSVLSSNFGGASIGSFKTIHNAPSDFVEYHKKKEKKGPVSTTQQEILAINSSGYNFQTPTVSVYKNDSVAFYKTLALMPTESIQQPTFPLSLRLNETLLQLATLVSNTDTTIVASPWNDGYFLNNRGDKVLGKINYTLSNAAGIVKSGFVFNPAQGLLWDNSGLIMARKLTPDIYTLKIELDDYQVQGRYGKAIAEYHFDTNMSDRNPPFLTQFELSVNGNFVNHFLKTDQAILTTAIWDESLSSYKVELKKTDATGWTTLPSDYKINLPDNLDEGFYSLRVSAVDNTGNDFTYTIEPAFLVGPNTNVIPFLKPVLIYPANNSSRIAQNSIFIWKEMNGVSSYNVQVATDSTFSSMIQNVNLTNDSLRFFTLFNSNTKYYWRVQGKYGDKGLSPWSSIFSFTTGMGTTIPIKLVSPANNSKVDTDHDGFKWTGVEGATSYQWQLVDKYPYGDYIANEQIVSGTFILAGLIPDSKWQWRVRPIYPGIDGEWTAYSFFSTGIPVVTPLTPANNSIIVSSDMTLNWEETFGGGLYRILISASPDLSNPVVDKTINSKPFNITQLKASTKYYWKVDVNYINLTASSPIWSFQTQDVLMSLLSPVDQALDQNLDISFSWNPMSFDTDYKFVLSPNQDLSNPMTSTLKGASFRVTGLESSTKYFWKVGVNYLGVDYWSNPYSFTTIHVLGVEEDKNTKLYPNPASAVVNFELASPYHDVTVINSLGQQIWSHKGYETSFVWNLAGIESGIYIAQINDGGKTMNRKIVVCR